METGPDSSPAIDAGVDVLAAEVARLAEPLVDSSGASSALGVGLSVVVVSRNDTRVFGFGAPVVGGAAPPDGTTCFPLGSVSKVFTGLVLASAIEASGGMVGPDHPVNMYLAADIRAPELAGTPITLEHLVSHYGALPDLPDNLTGRPFSPGADYTREQLATFLTGLELVRAPGTQYDYSNLGSGLLGIALADSAGVADFDALLRRDFTVGLGMGDTGTNVSDFRSRMGARLVQPYRVDGASLVEVDVADMGVLAGAGEVLATGDDMARFLRALTGLDEFPVAGAVNRALTPVGAARGSASISYALDLTTRPDGTVRYEKAGLTAGSSTFISFLRDPAVGVAVLSNRGGHSEIQGVARELVSFVEEL